MNSPFLWQYPEQAVGPVDTTFDERITQDKWTPQYPDFIWGRQPNTHQYFTIDVVQITQAERATPDKWQPETNRPPDDIKRQQHTYVFFHIDTDQLTQSERITLDKWNPLPNEPYLIDTPRHFYPSFFAEDLFDIPVVTEIPLDRWYRQPVERPPDKPRLNEYPYFFIDTDQLTQGERITFDKWWRQTSEPVRDLVRQQYTYPDFKGEDLFEVPAAPEVLMQWFQQTNEPLRLKPRAQNMPYFFIPPPAFTISDKISIQLGIHLGGQVWMFLKLK